MYQVPKQLTKKQYPLPKSSNLGYIFQQCKQGPNANRLKMKHTLYFAKQATDVPSTKAIDKEAISIVGELKVVLVSFNSINGVLLQTTQKGNTHFTLLNRQWMYQVPKQLTKKQFPLCESSKLGQYLSMVQMGSYCKPLKKETDIYFAKQATNRPSTRAIDKEAIPIVRELKVGLLLFNSVNRVVVQSTQLAHNEQKETDILLC